MQKEKILNQQNKVKIFQEVNFYQALHFLEIKQVPPQLIELIRVGPVKQTQIQTLKIKI